MPLATFLDGAPVDQLRGIAWLALAGSGYVVTPGGTSDSGGGRSGVSTTGSTIACRVDPLGGAESEIASRISDRSTHLITLPPQTSIDHTQKFYSIDEAKTYEITAVREATNDWTTRAEAVGLD